MSAPTVKFIFREISRRLGIPKEEIIEPRRFKTSLEARQIAALLLFEDTGRTHKQIAAILDGKHPSTITGALERANALFRENAMFRGIVESIRIRWQEKVLRQATTMARLKEPHDQAAGTAILRWLIPNWETLKPSSKEIIIATSEEFRILVETMRGKKQSRRSVEARHVAILLIWFLRKKTSMEIGNLLNKDHASILYGKNRMIRQVLMEKSPLHDRIRSIASRLSVS